MLGSFFLKSLRQQGLDNLLASMQYPMAADLLNSFLGTVDNKLIASTLRRISDKSGMNAHDFGEIVKICFRGSNFDHAPGLMLGCALKFMDHRYAFDKVSAILRARPDRVDAEMMAACFNGLLTSLPYVESFWLNDLVNVLKVRPDKLSSVIEILTNQPEIVPDDHRLMFFKWLTEIHPEGVSANLLVGAMRVNLSRQFFRGHTAITELSDVIPEKIYQEVILGVVDGCLELNPPGADTLIRFFNDIKARLSESIVVATLVKIYDAGWNQELKDCVQDRILKNFAPIAAQNDIDKFPPG